MNRFAVNTLIVFFGLTVGQVAFADNVTIPNVFQSGSPARASEVNDNFSAVEASVDDNAAEIANAAVRPPMVSLTGKPTRKGPVSASPVTLITPARPWTIWS